MAWVESERGVDWTSGGMIAKGLTPTRRALVSRSELVVGLRGWLSEA